MPRRCAFDGRALCILSVCLVLAWQIQGCKRKAVPRDGDKQTQNQASDDSDSAETTNPKNQPRVVNAAWYDAPSVSLAKRRAGASELTAAHDKLPIGTMVRVTRLSNGKSVNVKITDRGIHRRSVKLDLCKEAAEELGMVEQGVARVRMQVIDEKDGSAPPEPSPSPSP